MAMYRKQSGTNVAASPRRRSGSTWVTPSAAHRRLGTTWVSVWSALNLTASNVEWHEFRAHYGSPTRLTLSSNASAMVTGSTSYTVSWAYVSGSTAITCSNTSILNPLFSASVIRNSEEAATWQVTVTDIPSGQSRTAQVAVVFSYWTDQ